MTTNISPSFKKIADELEAIKSELQVRAKAAIEQETAILFAAYPALRAISWTQYTPYFNDGDPCYFGVNELQLDIYDWDKFVGESEDDEDYDDEDYDDGEWRYVYDLNYGAHKDDVLVKSLANDLGLFESGIQSIPDLLELIYDDHVRVIIGRNGTEVEDYQHD